jgi:hypothetical protein
MALKAALAGLSIIVVVGLLAALFPGSWWAQELSRPIRIPATGPEGRYRRRDLLRGALVASGLGAGLVGLAVVAYQVAEGFPNLSMGNHLATTYGFTFVLLAGVAFLFALICVVRSIWFRPDIQLERPPADDEGDA